MHVEDQGQTNTPVSVPVNSPEVDPSEASFAETALTLGGKSAEEARRTGAIDKADDQVEQLFKPQYQTVNSPAHRAVWDRGVPVELFLAPPVSTPVEVQTVMDESIAIVRKHRENSTMLGENGKVCWLTASMAVVEHRFRRSRTF